MLLLGFIAAVVGASIWLDQSHLARTIEPHVITYHFCAAPPAFLALDIALAGGVIAGVAWSLRRLGWPVTTAALTPLFLIGANLLAFGMFVPALADWWSPVAYFAIDMRAVTVAVAVGLSCAAVRRNMRADDRAAEPRPPADLAMRRALGDLAIAGSFVAFAVATTPYARFSALALGDEPKYVRYLENWWQGQGLRIDHLKSVFELPPDEPPRLLENVAMLGPAMRDTARSLIEDARLLSDPANWRRPFNRAVSMDHHVLRGKDGGFYQMHGPGLSLMLLPGYAIDRLFFDWRSSQFADDLFALNLLLVMVAGALAVVLFRTVEAWCGETAVALVATAAVMLSLPIAAFVFQIYPETPAALITVVAVRCVLMKEPLGWRTAVALGVAIGFLGWLHVRFLALAAVAIVWFIWTYRDRRGALGSLLLAFAASTAALCLYTYHITGSLIPSAPLTVAIGSGFMPSRVPSGLTAMLVDRTYGLLTESPVYVLALPGLGLMLRRQPQQSAWLAAMLLSLFIPSAGQGYWTDISVPLRHALAVLPLLAFPIALWLKERRSSTVWVSIALLAFALTIRTAITYNLWFDKKITTLVESSFSGWDISLVMPAIHRVRWSPMTSDAWLLLFAGAAVLALFVYGCLQRERPGLGAGARPAMGFATASAILLVVACIAAGAGAPRRSWNLLRVVPGSEVVAPASCWLDATQAVSAPR